MSAKAKIKHAGFELSLTDTGNLKIAPFNKLTDPQRQYIKAHKAEIITELEGEALQPWQISAITAWVHSLGGSPGNIAEELADCLQQCRNSPDALVYYLKRSTECLPPNPDSTPLATCGTCTRFNPHHAHGKGSGDCKAGVKPLGLCHWSETQHPCTEFTQQQESFTCTQ